MQENCSSGFPTRTDINRPVQSQRKARSLKIRILQDEGLYYLCSEKKIAYKLICSVTAALICTFVFA